MLKLIQDTPELKPFEGDLNMRMERYAARKKELLINAATLSDFANGHHFFGLHRTKDGWVYREWAPSAHALYLTGDFNGWNRRSHPLRSLGDGTWEIVIPGRDAIADRSRIKVVLVTYMGEFDRIPLYARYVTQNVQTTDFCMCVFEPEQPYQWHDQGFVPTEEPPVIYESHVGMAVEEQRVGTYREFQERVLPWMKQGGYNTLQLMAIMEHPYYGSFGYQVSNFFAASSRYGTPDELKAMIDTAHSMGITVLLDLVHSHAVRNFNEGINCFDGTVWQFFKDGPQGDHPAWGSKVFDYGRTGVMHFLLSNLKFWMEEYHFDGFRFDGVTSMLYHDHGLGVSFDSLSKYFSMNTDVDAVTYLMLATELIHEVKPGAICIAEDMSAMPGMCRPIADGGIGFDYRLSMGLPDFFIRTIKEKTDGHWDLGRMYWELQTRRPGEKTVAYAESHDQALVGDKTLMFRLADAQMYDHMRLDQPSIIIDRAMALHKMIRLVTIGAGGEGYLNFMGNEFGHPEWIDFPREGNGWSYSHARRQWSLAADPELRFGQLLAFDRAMVALINEKNVMGSGPSTFLLLSEEDQLLAYERGGLIFVFNFHPEKSQTALQIPLKRRGSFRATLSTDDPAFGGQGRTSGDYVYHSEGSGFQVYLPARCALVLRRTRPVGSGRKRAEK